MLEARVVTCSVRKEPRALYEMLWAPEMFPKWASGLSNASLERDGVGWRAIGPAGPIRIVFSARNEFGVMDHWVEPEGGRMVYVPMRIVANDDGSEVSLTLFRQPGMADETFAADAAWIETDLAALKSLAESPQ